MKSIEHEGERTRKSPTVGGLALYVVGDAKNWHGGKEKGDRFLEVRFTGDDWDALFYEQLNCPEPEPYIEGQDSDEYIANLRINFQRSIPEYPMLGRIFDMYVNVGYEPREVISLQEECLRIRAGTANPRALRALEKLLFACAEASRGGLGLFFVSD